MRPTAPSVPRTEESPTGGFSDRQGFEECLAGTLSRPLCPESDYQ